MSDPDAIVVGAGVIGLSIAWRAATSGISVEIVDEQPGRGASHAGAGMLAPVTEVHYGEQALLALNIASARRYESFVHELEAAADMTVGYRREGTLVVAADSDEAVALDTLFRFQRELDLPVQRLRRRDCRALEPMLAPSVRGGLLAEGDHQVDNRRLVDALLAAVSRRGVIVHHHRATELQLDGTKVRGVALADGTVLGTRTVVLAAGCWSATLAGVPAAARPPVRPVKGQILRLRASSDSPFLTRTVRGLVGGRAIYLVSRADGDVVVGATVEERGFDTAVTAGAVYELLHDATAIVPGVSELEAAEATAGLRPGSPDNAPLLGATGVDGLVVATGHYRNGFLLAPITADAITELLLTGQVPEAVAPFSPLRFARDRSITEAIEESVS
jgi:glycine oxidase